MKCLGLDWFGGSWWFGSSGFSLNNSKKNKMENKLDFLALFSSFFCFSIPIYVGVGESMSGWMNSCEYGFGAGCLHSKVGPQVHLGVDFIVDIVHYESSNYPC